MPILVKQFSVHMLIEDKFVLFFKHFLNIFKQVSNSYVDLFNFYMNYASVTNTLLGAATNVENCSCPTGFTVIYL